MGPDSSLPDFAKVRRKLRRASRLSTSQWRGVARACFDLYRIRVLLLLGGFTRTLAVLGRGVSNPLEAEPVGALAPQLTHADRIAIGAAAEAVDIAARNSLPPATCLPRALALWTSLHRLEIPSRVRIGVRRETNGLDAHAWVEVAGLPVGERLSIAAAFVPLESASNVSMSDFERVASVAKRETSSQ